LRWWEIIGPTTSKGPGQIAHAHLAVVGGGDQAQQAQPDGVGQRFGQFGRLVLTQ
jgi:hypothetical protein